MKRFSTGWDHISAFRRWLWFLYREQIVREGRSRPAVGRPWRVRQEVDRFEVEPVELPNRLG